MDLKLTIDFCNFANAPKNVDYKRNYRWTAVSGDSVSAVDCSPKKNLEIKEINGS